MRWLETNDSDPCTNLKVDPKDIKKANLVSEKYNIGITDQVQVSRERMQLGGTAGAAGSSCQKM